MFHSSEIWFSCTHTWRGQVQFRSILNEHHELRQNNVRTPRTQPGNGGKFSVFRYFCYVNNQIKTTTENLPTQPHCVPGVLTDSLSNFVAFIENGMKLKLTMPNMQKIRHPLPWLPPNSMYDMCGGIVDEELNCPLKKELWRPQKTHAY